jgi:hypothetical protein
MISINALLFSKAYNPVVHVTRKLNNVRLLFYYVFRHKKGAMSPRITPTKQTVLKTELFILQVV